MDDVKRAYLLNLLNREAINFLAATIGVLEQHGLMIIIA
jgi:hypothetical protein